MNLNGPIVIIGFMGCGKTAVARALAHRLDLPIVDLDNIIAEQHGRTAAQLIREDGEPVFRAVETKVLHQLLERGERSVISLGGGAWITEANRRLIDQYNCVTIWLDTPFELCWQRIEASTEDRPLGRTREQAEQLYRVRQPVYRQATIHLPIQSDESVDSVVDRLEPLINTDEHGQKI
ncbi:MAG TPA: shikimate kinase [Pyrinomonadaceae bacterium]|nr:shikimate kinase [Pyrinomonadaceae bacterium]